MKTIIAGSRGVNDYSKLLEALLECQFPITAVICGMCSGADMLGYQFAKEFKVPIIEMSADWSKYGRSAGYLRNTEMAKIADACIVLWDGSSKGSKHMIDLANKYKLKLHIKLV